MLLKNGDTVGLISCSDGLNPDDQRKIQNIEQTLATLGLHTRKAETLFRQSGTPFSGTPQERAGELMRLFCDPAVRAIFDVSGGDSSNQILPFLDYPMIQKAETPFIGISDLSVITNAIYTRTGSAVYHYRIKNLAGPYAEEQKRIFLNSFMSRRPVYDFSYRWLSGTRMEGVTIGGNIRCFLKLAGTPYFPDPSGKIIFLEALGGGPARMASLLAQLDQLSVFEAANGILLGTFSEMQKKELTPEIEQLVLEITEKYGLPVAKTEQLGHGENARCLPIGLPVTLN
ncbi:LD-carboxypeptidase [Sporolactobacillus sp. THM7-4]|nr:LD-carboxypeptidase [Sporolactobacillus sp. THM7-4]